MPHLIWTGIIPPYCIRRIAPAPLVVDVIAAPSLDIILWLNDLPAI